MKRILLVLLFFGLVLNLSSQTVWTVESVPNTRLESNDIHVSDPDGFLSDSTEMTINTALCSIRDKADVFVVTLASIGDAAPKPFATELFNYWGIGDAATNNGVLLLFVEDQHALEFETGYGAEETMTDATCERIFTNSIVPYFRAGDYEGGLCAGVADIVETYGGEVPVGLKSTLPSYDEDESYDDGMSFFSMIFYLFMLFMPVLGFGYWIKKRTEKQPEADTARLYNEDGVTYLDGSKTSWKGSPWIGKGCLAALLMGLHLR